MSRRRQQRSTGGRLVIWAFVLGLLVAALMYLRCGEGFGFGPGGGDDGDDKSDKDEATRDEVRPAVGGEPARRCQLRVDAEGVTIDGKKAEVDAAVAACKTAGGAELTATGDAKYGTVEELKAALERESVPVLVRDPATAAPRAP
jgi:hypothetical protein